MITTLTTIFAQGTQVQQRGNCKANEAPGANCLSSIPRVAADNTELQKGLAILFGVLAAVAVVVIILGAINYITAEGNPEGLSKSKKTIIYALVGLIISLSAEVAVLTLIGRL